MREDRGSHGEPLRGEHEDDQSERQMSELMTEVRIVMPGVQVLFAFLLTVPFQSAFDEVMDTEPVLYVLTLLSSAVASACLIACAAHSGSSCHSPGVPGRTPADGRGFRPGLRPHTRAGSLRTGGDGPPRRAGSR